MNIQKVLIIILLTGMLTLHTKAQEFGGGIIAGISSSQLSGDHLGGFDKTGIIIGAYTNRYLSNNISVKMELIYIQKGSKNPSGDLRHEFYLNYFEIPLIIQYKIQENIKLEGGMQLGFLINEKEKDAVLNGEYTLREPFNKTDITVAIGIDYQFSNNFSLNTRLSNTLLFTPVRNHVSESTVWYNQGQYNNILSFTLHYHF